jgi:hypothetical protein
MEWLTQLQGHVVGLDTAPLIYFIEQNDVYLELVRGFFDAMSHNEFQVVTSTLTLTEVLVHPPTLWSYRTGSTVSRHYSRPRKFNYNTCLY